MILLLDNYDSFTFNLFHYVEMLTEEHTDVFRNDEITVRDVNKYDKILLSPGPGLPADAGVMNEIIRQYAPEKKILGICLGHQAVGEVFGAKLKNLSEVHHGVMRQVIVKDKKEKIFKGIPPVFDAGRYHSWVVDANTVPEELNITAVDNQNEVMALAHSKYDVRGIQFHPESIMTKFGKQLLENWLKD